MKDLLMGVIVTALLIAALFFFFGNANAGTREFEVCRKDYEVTYVTVERRIGRRVFTYQRPIINVTETCETIIIDFPDAPEAPEIPDYS